MTIAHSLSVYQSHFVVGTGKVMCVKSSVKQVVGPQDRCLMITKHQLHISTYWTGTRFGGLECHFAQPIRASHRHSNLKKDIFFKYTCVTLFLNYDNCIALLKSILRFFTCRSYKVDCRTSKFLFTTRDEFFFLHNWTPMNWCVNCQWNSCFYCILKCLTGLFLSSRLLLLIPIFLSTLRNWAREAYIMSFFNSAAFCPWRQNVSAICRQGSLRWWNGVRLAVSPTGVCGNVEL